MSKVRAVPLGPRIIKIAATTLGETGGDTVTMTLNWGYLAGTALFLGLLVALVVAQILAKQFNTFLYWGHDRRLHHVRHDDGRLRRPVLGVIVSGGDRAALCCDRRYARHLSGAGR